MLHYTALITLQLQQQLLPQLQQQYQLHHITLHCTHCTAVHYNYVQIQMQLQLHYTRLHYARLHYTRPHYSTQHYSTLQYATPRHNYNYNCNCNYTTLITHSNYNSTTPHYNYNYNCTTPHYIQQLWVRWPLQPLQPLQKTQLQPPFGPSVDWLCHPSLTTTNLSYRFPIFETSAAALCGTTGR